MIFEKKGYPVVMYFLIILVLLLIFFSFVDISDEAGLFTGFVTASHEEYLAEEQEFAKIPEQYREKPLSESELTEEQKINRELNNISLNESVLGSGEPELYSETSYAVFYLILIFVFVSIIIVVVILLFPMIKEKS